MEVIGWVICMLIAIFGTLWIILVAYVEYGFSGKISIVWLIPVIGVITFWWFVVTEAPFVIVTR